MNWLLSHICFVCFKCYLSIEDCFKSCWCLWFVVSFENMETINASFLYELRSKGGREAIDLCMKVGLIADERRCKVCGKAMEVVLKKKGATEDYVWRCRKSMDGVQHDECMSVRKGSWFEFSKLSICNILLVTFHWFHKLPNKYTEQMLQMSSSTVVDWKSFCREICMEACVKESKPIGGVNVIVEIDEIKFGKRKYNRGKAVRGKWVIGGLEKGSHKMFFRVVKNRGKDVLLDIIKTFVLPGTTIISKCWKSYDCLEDERYRHLMLNHSLKFKNPENGVHTNSIEGMWSTIKRSLSISTNHCKDHFDGYLAEYMWRRSHPSQKFTDFLEAVRCVYAPSDNVSYIKIQMCYFRIN